MAKQPSRLQRIRANARALLDERAPHSQAELSRLQRFVHFWVLVWRSFVRNRCPVRASALAYVTLLALIPMLAVVISVTSSFLKKEGEAEIDHFIVKLVSSVTPPAMVSTNSPPLTTAPAATVESTNTFDDDDPDSGPELMARAPTNAPAIASPPLQGSVLATNSADATQGSFSSLAQDQKAIAARKEIARNIHKFIQNTRSGALGVTGSILLIFAAISMLTRIEDTFNDIWGVVKGRGWFMRIVLYWGVLSLAPLLLVVALGLASGPHLQGTKKLLAVMPLIGPVVFEVLPVILLCLAFGAFYMLMPNTKVHWRAALVGGLVSGALFHLNNAVSVLYVSRVVSNSKIYGSLGLVPVFMIGLYLSWLILLFGAQVAYAYQNRFAYFEEKQVENINQRGREFIALRLMTSIGQRFELGTPPPSVADMSEELCVPGSLIRQLIQTLARARLVAETAAADPAYLPARPLQMITCHDVLVAMRASQGQELETRDEPARVEVYGEYQRIQEAERQAANSVTMQALVRRSLANQIRDEPSQLAG